MGGGKEGIGEFTPRFLFARGGQTLKPTKSPLKQNLKKIPLGKFKKKKNRPRKSENFRAPKRKKLINHPGGQIRKNKNDRGVTTKRQVAKGKKTLF